MNRRLKKLIEEKAWETLTDYGYNDSQLLEQLTEKVLERLDEQIVGTPKVPTTKLPTSVPTDPRLGKNPGTIPGYLNPPVRGGEGFIRGGVRYWRGPDGQIYRWFGEPSEGGRGWVPVSAPETPFGS